MNEIIEFLTQYHKKAPPFISENEDGSYSLVGSSDEATRGGADYGELGNCKLTAKNHTNTLIALMNYIILLDAMSDSEELSFEDEEVIIFLQSEFCKILSAYFDKNSEEFSYSQELAMQFLKDNPQLVNEALYNITNDKKEVSQIDYQQLIDSLEGSQFEDPYVSIAYQIAKEFKLRPLDVIENWSTAELIVVFAKLANDQSLEAFLNWKYSQEGAPKRKPPKKQAFLFKEAVKEDE